MRNRRSVLNVSNFDSCGSQRTNRRFASRARTAHPHLNAAHTMIARHIGGVLRGLLGGKWRPLTRSAEAERPGTLPRQHIASLIRDRHDRVVERGLDMGNTVRNVLPLFFS